MPVDPALSDAVDVADAVAAGAGADGGASAAAAAQQAQEAARASGASTTAAAQAAAQAARRARKPLDPWAAFAGSLKGTGVGSKCTTTCTQHRRTRVNKCDTVCEPYATSGTYMDQINKKQQGQDEADNGAAL